MFLSTIQSPVAQRDGFTHWAPGLSLSTVGCRVTPLPSELIQLRFLVFTALQRFSQTRLISLNITLMIQLLFVSVGKITELEYISLLYLLTLVLLTCLQKYESLFIFFCDETLALEIFLAAMNKIRSAHMDREASSFNSLQCTQNCGNSCLARKWIKLAPKGVYVLGHVIMAS